MKKLISYLFQGLLLLAPVGITAYIIYALFNIVDNSVNDFLESVFHIRFRGLGLIIIICLITFIGFLSSTLLFGPIFSFVESLITRTPLIKIIYTAFKDLFSAFVSDKKKFNQPVLVNLNGNPNFQKLGFMTEDNLSSLGLHGKVAVYLPHSYNFSGNLFIVDVKDVTYLNISVSDLMKFIVSGGVTEMESNNYKNA